MSISKTWWGFPSENTQSGVSNPTPPMSISPSPTASIVIPNQYLSTANQQLVVNNGEQLMSRVLAVIAEYCADILSYGGQVNDVVVNITRLLSHKPEFNDIDIYSPQMGEFINTVAYDIISVLILNKTHADHISSSSAYEFTTINPAVIIFRKFSTDNAGIF